MTEEEPVQPPPAEPEEPTPEEQPHTKELPKEAPPTDEDSKEDPPPENNETQEPPTQPEAQEEAPPNETQEEAPAEKQEAEGEQAVGAENEDEEPLEDEEAKFQATLNEQDRERYLKQKRSEQFKAEKREDQIKWRNIIRKNVQDTAQALEDGKKVVYLQRCFNCRYHQWCSFHKEEKYDDMENKLRAAQASTCGEDYFLSVNTQEEWQLGCFEIFANGSRLFSKIEKKIWPSMKLMADRAKLAFEGESK